MANHTYVLPWIVARKLIFGLPPEDGLSHAQVILLEGVCIRAQERNCTFPSGRAWHGFFAWIDTESEIPDAVRLQKFWTVFQEGPYPVPNEHVVAVPPEKWDLIYDENPDFWKADGEKFAYRLGKLIGEQDGAAYNRVDPYRHRIPIAGRQLEEVLFRLSGLLPETWGVNIDDNLRKSFAKGGGDVTRTDRWRALLPTGLVTFRQIALAGYVDGYGALYPEEQERFDNERQEFVRNCRHSWTCDRGYDVGGSPMNTNMPMSPEYCSRCGTSRD